MTIIEKIKAEIERLKAVQFKCIQEGDLVDAEPYDKNEAYNELLSFLDTLEESERPEPYNPVYDEAYLNEKIKKATESWKGVDVDAMLAECRGYDEEKSEKPMNLEEEISRYLREECSGDDEPSISEIARHFAQWGADHTPLPEDTVLFNKGVAEGKRLMMDEWLKDRDGCFWDGVEEGKKAMKDAILAIIESRLSEIIGDAQPKPALRAELEELIKRIKDE